MLLLLLEAGPLEILVDSISGMGDFLLVYWQAICAYVYAQEGWGIS
jgi:hypothetical protein